MKARLLFACLLCGCAQGADAPLAPLSSATDASVGAASRSSGTPAGAMKHLRTALARSAQDLRVERRSERLHLDMNGTFQTASVIAFDADGQPSKRCLDSTDQLDHMLGESP